MPLDTEYLLVDDYVDSQNRQNQLLNNEFRSVRESIDEVKQELKEFKDDVKEFKDDVKEFKDDVKAQFADVRAQFARIDERFDHLDLNYRRMAAYSRNNNLRNPTLPINPIVSYLPGRGIIHPQSSLYPRNAKEFYSLRKPTSTRHERVLAYLIDFYDLPYNTWAAAPSADEDDGSSTSEGSAPRHNITVDDAVRYYSDLAVDLLEGILGLNQENFDKFVQRAAELQQRQPQPIKRHLAGQGMESGDGQAANTWRRRQEEPKRPRPLDIRPYQRDAKEDDEEGTSPPVGWANGHPHPSTKG